MVYLMVGSPRRYSIERDKLVIVPLGESVCSGNSTGTNGTNLGTDNMTVLIEALRQNPNLI
jgi:hypothetical protein